MAPHIFLMDFFKQTRNAPLLKMTHCSGISEKVYSEISSHFEAKRVFINCSSLGSSACERTQDGNSCGSGEKG